MLSIYIMWKWVLLAGLALAVAAQVPSLDEHNADQFFAQNRVAVVKFFAPWCGHCKAMAPEFVKLHAEADFAVAEVDCTTSESLCERYRVEGYPTVRLFVSGHYVEYEGERTAKGIAGWVQ